MSGDNSPSWTGELSNPKAISSLFDTEPRAEWVHELRLHRDGPTLDLVFDVDGLPARPPRKWQQFDAVQVRLRLEGVGAVSVDGWGQGNRVEELSLGRAGGGLQLVVRGDEIQVHATAVVATVVGVSGYLRGTP